MYTLDQNSIEVQNQQLLFDIRGGQNRGSIDAMSILYGDEWRGSYVHTRSTSHIFKLKNKDHAIDCLRIKNKCILETIQ